MKYKICYFLCLLCISNYSFAQQQLQLSGVSNLSVVNGSTISNQSAFFSLKNATTGFSTYSPQLQVTVSLSNQQFASIPSNIISTSTGTSFGSSVNNFGDSAISVPTFDSLSATSTPSNAVFSSSSSLINSGIDVIANKGFNIYNTVNQLFLQNEPVTGRFYYADITLTFSRPVSNPVLHFSGLGGNVVFGPSNVQGFATDFELLNTNYSLSKLSGSNELNVTSNVISNSSSTFGFTTGSGAASGSVLVSGTNITALTFRMYVKGDGNGTAWSNSGVNSGDEFLLSVSLDKPVNISGNVFNDGNGLIDSIVNGIGTNLSGLLYMNLIDTAGKVVSATPVASDGTYSFEAIGKGNYSLILSTIQGVQGANAPLKTLPTNWYSTGENLGTLVGNDGLRNSELSIVIDTLDVVNANFGLAQCNTISNASLSQTICTGSTSNNLTVNTTLNQSVRFVRFSSSQVSGSTPTTTQWNTIVAGTTIATVIPQGATSPYTATYNFNASDFPNNTSSAITYYVYVLNELQLDSSCRSYQLITITVSPNPVMNPITGNFTICEGTTANLSNLTPNGVWSSSNQTVASISTTGVIFGVSGGTATIKYVVTNASGCKDSISQLVTVAPTVITPIITASGSTSACLGTGFTLTSSSSSTYQWFKDGVAIAGATTQTYQPTSSGSYTMVVIAGGGACNATSNAISVSMSFATTPSIYPPGDTVTICTKANERLCPTTWGHSNYQWYRDGVVIPGPDGTASCYVPSLPGRYTLTVQASNGCWSMPSAATNVKIDTTCTGNITSGNGGGVENKPLGSIIAQRLYGKSMASISSEFEYEKATPFIKNNLITENSSAGNIKLSSLFPAVTLNTNRSFISTPNDLVNFTNAIDIFSVDYLNNTQTRAVGFVTKTLGEVYSHTKVICDRLKEAELQEVKKVTIKGLDFITSKLKHHSGEVEYLIHFSVGVTRNKDSFGLQSSWVTDNFTKQDTMYNFQIWAGSFSGAISLANNVLNKLDSIRPITALAASTKDMPVTYVSKVVRDLSNIELDIFNPTISNSVILKFVEKKNENAVAISKSQQYSIKAFGSSKISIPVSDFYEHNVYVYIDGKLVDLVYISDGSWSADYDKSVTSLNKFEVLNDPSVNVNVDEYPLFRSINIEATSKQGISAYKLLKGSGLPKNLNDFKGIKFEASSKGTSTLKITIIKKGINDWNNQYTYKLSVTSVSKEYAIGLDKFTSNGNTGVMQMNDISAIIFTWENTRGSVTTIGGTLSKVRFTKKDISFEQAIVSKEITVYPNPNNGKFNITFMAEEDKPLVLKLVDVGTGRVIETKFISAKKGSNTVNVVANINVANLTAYYLILEGDGVKYKPQKMLITQ